MCYQSKSSSSRKHPGYTGLMLLSLDSRQVADRKNIVFDIVFDYVIVLEREDVDKKYR
jgi:hypothetical protein